MRENFIEYFAKNQDRYFEAILVHLGITAAAVLIGLAIGIPLAVLSVKLRKASQAILNTFSLLRMIPSLAILMLAIPIIGTGVVPAVAALTLLVVPVILINTCLGFKEIDPAVQEAAGAMGFSKSYILFRIEFPLALPLILTGLRTATVEVIASATLAAYIGSGGLGLFIITGFGLLRTDILLLGGGTVAILSIAIDAALARVSRRAIRYCSTD
jgi:osmoprotectant transport system permease protein